MRIGQADPSGYDFKRDLPAGALDHGASSGRFAEQ